MWGASAIGNGELGVGLYANLIPKACMDKGVLCLTAKDKVRLLPALNIPQELLEKAIGVIKEVCK